MSAGVCHARMSHQPHHGVAAVRLSWLTEQHSCTPVQSDRAVSEGLENFGDIPILYTYIYIYIHMYIEIQMTDTGKSILIRGLHPSKSVHLPFVRPIDCNMPPTWGWAG